MPLDMTPHLELAHRDPCLADTAEELSRQCSAAGFTTAARLIAAAALELKGISDANDQLKEALGSLKRVELSAIDGGKS